MPSNRRRFDRPSENDLRRRSALGSPASSTQSKPVDFGPQAERAHSTEPSMGMRDSVISLDNANIVSAMEPAVSSPSQTRTPRHHRFSMLKFRHASDSQLSKTAKEHERSNAPPVPWFPTPSIVTTAPTSDELDGNKRKSTFGLSRRVRSPGPGMMISTKTSQRSLRKAGSQRTNNESIIGQSNLRDPRLAIDGSGGGRGIVAPPAYGDESNSTLALPVSRVSESSRSDGSSGDHGVFATTTTTTHTVSTTTTFFRLSRKKKDRGPLFPLPARVDSGPSSAAGTPRISTGNRSFDSPIRHSVAIPQEHYDMYSNSSRTSGQPSPTRAALTATSISFAHAGSGMLRSESRTSRRSTRSSNSPTRPTQHDSRGRSSRMSSWPQGIHDDPLPTPLLQPTRTSTSTAGRPSLGGLFSLARLKQSSEPVLSRNGFNVATPGTPGSVGSKQNSINLGRESSIVIPERQEGDTPAKYLARLEEVVSRGAIATLLSKSGDEFTKNVLRSYMRRFKFFEDPLDMAIRKMLMHVELPRETQHIDRTLQSFADRYHECNPGIFASPDEAYFIAFSLLILHTDVFNRNNKNKMQKHDYTKNTSGQGVAQEILECFYDNIAYTPFIHVEDDVDVHGVKVAARKPRKPGSRTSGQGLSLRRSGVEPVDPYTLILDGKLGDLRPALEEVIVIQDPFNYLVNGTSINIADLHRTFFKSGVIQIVSSRSRPEAFLNQATITNPAEAQVGVVDMKVTKVGILWRKDAKKKKTRSPWQEWGAVLTGSQLYFFRNTTWVKTLMHQHDHHSKYGRTNTPVIFKPPLEQFKPDFLISTEDVVALVDSQYRKHKNAFVFTSQSVFQEIFLADNDAELNDWLAKLNYAAAFRTAGVRMRGVVGSHYEGISSDGSESHELSDQPRTPGSARVEVSKSKSGPVNELARQVMVARRQIMTQKIAEANERLSVSEKQLDLYLRNARHLKILAPVQAKTRQEVVTAARQLDMNIRWARIESWRVRCHRDILTKDLAEDIRLSSGSPGGVSDQHQTSGLSPQPSVSAQSRSPFSRLGSKSSVATTITGSRASRPSSQPTGTKLFSMEDMFRSPSKMRSQHRPQSSWELPPLSFERDGPVSVSRHSPMAGSQLPPAIEKAMSYNLPISQISGPPRRATLTKMVSPTSDKDQDDHKLLIQAGLVSPEGTGSEPTKLDDHTSDEERSKHPEIEGGDSLSKVRHSLQRKLQNAHVPNHHRSRKNKESSSSAAMSEEPSSVAESEGLARKAGSFVVHGKKASVIKFGSEWQNMSPEEKLNLRKSAQADGSKVSIPHPVEDDALSDSSEVCADARPLSATSTSTTTARSFQPLSSIESEPRDSSVSAMSAPTATDDDSIVVI